MNELLQQGLCEKRRLNQTSADTESRDTSVSSLSGKTTDSFLSKNPDGTRIESSQTRVRYPDRQNPESRQKLDRISRKIRENETWTGHGQCCPPTSEKKDDIPEKIINIC